MLTELWQWIPFNTWASIAGLVVGTLVIAPLLLSRSFRKRLRDVDPSGIEGIGLIVLVVAVAGISLYKYFSLGAGA